MRDLIYSGTPYWLHHAFIGGLISVSVWVLFPCVGSLLSGFMFYLGREIRDWEKLHNWALSGFDWKGLLAPFVVSIILMIIA